jgi:hypothetical protein
MQSYLTSIGAAMGTLLGVLNSGWFFWKAYKERARLLVEVEWDWSGGDYPEETSSPRVTVHNSGGRKVYIAEIYLAELIESAGVLRCIPWGLQKPTDRRVWCFDALENPELLPDRSCPPRQCNWDDGVLCWPKFDGRWKALCVVVRVEGGKDAKKWRSKAPTAEPSWFSRYAATHAYKPALPPEVGC